MNLNHAHIKVPDIAKARKFFETHLSFRLHFNHGDGIFMVNDAGFLLAIDPYETSEPRFSFPDWFHLGFCLDEPQKVRDSYARMKADGVEFARELREFDGNAVNLYCLAPGGYKIEVSWNREDAV